MSDALAEFMTDPLKEQKIKGGKREKALSEIERATRLAEKCGETGDWSNADARTLLGLYALCHRTIYGVAPVELENVAEFRVASRAALTILHGHFSDDVVAAALFVRWCWKREKERAEWAKTANRDRNRMGWRMQFSAKLVTDFLVARAARKGG